MSAEVVAVKLGRTLAGRAARLWLASRQRDQETQWDMEELIRLRIPGLRAQRGVQRQFEQIADAVAARLEPMLAHELRGIDDGERTAAADAVMLAFERADLSDAAILGSDADPVQLARRVRAQVSPPVGLSEAALGLYELLLAECCDCYVRILRRLPVFTERAVTELLGRVSALGAELSVVLERLPARSLYAPAGRSHDEDFRREFLGLISRTLDEVELFSFATEQALRTKLSVAYISLRVSAGSDAQERAGRGSAAHRAVLRPGIAAWDSAGRESGGMRVETVLGNKPRVLVRGEAGSGKTTLLHWLAITAARGAFTGELKSWNGLVPILVRLRSYAGRDLPGTHELLDNTAGPLTGHMPRAWVDRELVAGRVLLMVDGVDELLPGERRNVREWLRLLLHSYPDTRVVVTSRPGAARQDWLNGEGFTAVSLERMTPPDLDAFIHQWHQAVRAAGDTLPCAAEELPHYERALAASLRDRPHLQALAASPLLAAMVCSMHLSRHRQLPRNRMELYQIAVELLVQRRDMDRRVPSAQGLALSLTDKLDVLQDLAWRLSDNNRAELGTDKALVHVTAKIASMRHVEADPQQILEHLVGRSGVLRTPVEGRIDFVHRTFQEYLAAAEAAAEDRIGNLIERAHLDQWRETIIMAAGHANRAQRDELMTGILARAEDEARHARTLRLLAASCLETTQSLSDELAEKVDGAIQKVLPPRREADAPSLAAVGEPLVQRLPSTLTGLSTISARATVRMLALIGGAGALRLLSGYALDHRHLVHRELLEAWEYFDPADYAEEVLAKLPLERPGLQLELRNPSQWEAAIRLRHARGIHISYPTTFDEVQLDELPELHTLWLTSLKGRTDPTRLLRRPHLRNLVLFGYGGDSILEAPAALAALAELTSLQLHRWENLPPLDKLPLPDTLEFLGLSDLPAGTDLTALETLLQLSGIYLQGSGKPSGLATLHRMSRLTWLSLDGFDLDDQLSILAHSCPNMENLVLHRCTLPADLAPLAGLPALARLQLINCHGPEGSPVDLTALTRRGTRPRLSVELQVTEAVGATSSPGSTTRIRRIQPRVPWRS